MKRLEANLPSNIEVHIRLRPLLSAEKLSSPDKSIYIINQKRIIIGNDREFNFDMVYSENSTNREIFETSIINNLNKSLEGYNFSTLLYGQTVILHLN